MKLVKKSIMMIVVSGLIASSVPMYGVETDYSDIDPLSRDILIKNGLLIEDDNKETEAIDTKDVEKLNHEKDSEDDDSKTSLIGEDYYIYESTVLGESDLLLKFSQDIDKNSLSKSYFKIRLEDGSMLSTSKYSLRKVEKYPNQMIIKFEEPIFKERESIELNVNKSMKSSYGINFDASKSVIQVSGYDFEDIKAEKLYSYKNGLVDIYFNSEVPLSYVRNSRSFLLSYGNNYAYKQYPGSARIIEDENGVGSILRLRYGVLDEKYDYKLSYSKIELEYKFPGPSYSTQSITVSDIEIIDSMNIVVALSSSLGDNTEDIRLRLVGKGRIKNYKIVEDKIYVSFYESGQLEADTEYKIIIDNIIDKDFGNRFSIVSTFLLGKYGDFKSSITPKIYSHEWLGNGILKVSFNKPMDLRKNIGMFLDIKDLDNNSIKYSNIYGINPMEYVITLDSGNDNEPRLLEFKNLRELNFETKVKSLSYDTRDK